MKYSKLKLGWALSAATLSFACSIPAAQAAQIDRTADCTSATGCTLDSLFDTGTDSYFFRVSDKVFDNFSATLNRSSNTMGQPFPDNFGAVTIKGVQNSVTNNVDLQLTSGFFAGQNQMVDLNLFFDVTADSGNLISAVDLFGNLSARNGGYAEIAESVFDNSPGATSLDLIGRGVIDTLGGTIPDPITIALDRSVSSVTINKDILLVGGEASSDVATLSFVGQSFEQTTAVPTPALLPGLIGFGMSLLRKKNKQEALA